MFKVIGKIQDKLGHLYGSLSPPKERIGLEQDYKGRDLVSLMQGILGTEEEIGMESVLEQFKPEKYCAG